MGFFYICSFVQFLTIKASTLIFISLVYQRLICNTLEIKCIRLLSIYKHLSINHSALSGIRGYAFGYDSVLKG